MDRAQLIEQYLRERHSLIRRSNSTSVDNDDSVYRLVTIDTPLTPVRDDLDLSKELAHSKKYPSSIQSPLLTLPSEFLEHHPIEQDTRNLPDLKVKPKARRKLPEIPKDKKPLEGISLAEEFKAIDANLLVTPFSNNLYLEVDTSGKIPKSTFRYYKDPNKSGERYHQISIENGNNYHGGSEKSRRDTNKESDDSDDAITSPSSSYDIAKLKVTHIEAQAQERKHRKLSNITNGGVFDCNGIKNNSENMERDLDSGHSSSTVSSPAGSSLFKPISRLRISDATHRGIHRFVPRHADELAVDLGDPVYVIRECSLEDSWCEGINLTTGRRGLFPNAYVTDVEYTNFGSDKNDIRRERFLLHFLGSVEVSQHKGNEILCQAIRKIIREANRKQAQEASKQTPIGTASPKSSGECTPTFSSGELLGHSCVLEVSEEGVRIVDRQSMNGSTDGKKLDYFFNLKNVTFCGYHPTDHRYFGFISKHPLLKRFACHIFFADDGAREVAESVGSAFERFYHKFMELTFPTEDIYIDDPAI